MRKKIKRKNALVTLGFAIVIMLVTVQTAYEPPPMKNPPAGWGPSFSMLDYAIFLTASVIVGMVLDEMEDIIWSWVGSVLLSFVMSVIYSSLFNWFVLGWGETFSLDPWEGWQIVCYWSALALFRIMFPSVIILFIGLCFGGFLGDVTMIIRKIKSRFFKANSYTK